MHLFGHLRACLDYPQPLFRLAPLGELEEGKKFQADVSFDDQCGIFVELDDTFYEEYSLDESSVVEFREVTPSQGAS